MTTDNEQSVIRTLVAQSHRLDELISYQEGAVVSRTIINKKSGTITLFAFDAGQGLSEHATPYDALVQIIDGEAKIAISNKAMRIKAGEILILPANEPHSLKASQRFKMILTMLKS
ncbi:MAG: cupin domain-containing protein [Candidatus Bathyarchaeota archaeon]|nr:MAG: cupin domain-containing protein [Candidatus Bathyarchaeota archaeon]